MTEQIGKITLDYTYYPGQDFYSDGTIEDTLLEIVKNNPPSAYRKIIEDKAEWPILYHLSPLRENIVSWLPIDSSMKVLEVGSGCGAITGALSQKAGSVTCIELSKKRSHINAYRHKDCENVTIQVGNFKDIEPQLDTDYDYVLLIGVFEYGQSYMGTDTPYEDFLHILKKHVSTNGRIVIAIENKFGLKYWAGCKEDHYGDYFSGIEDYPNGGGIRTFTRRGLEKIVAANEVKNYSFYYPYPDYKFTTSVYSDSYLPKVGELSTNLRNFDRDRLLLFDEKNAFNNIIREGLFPLYSNSYLVVIGEELETKYAKYSNDRDEKFAIRTDIRLDKQGIPYVAKVPMSEEAKSHVKHIEDAYKLLSRRYEGGKLKWNRCELKNEELMLEFLHGITLEEIFDELLNNQDVEGFLALFTEYTEAIDYNGEADISDFDLIFGNIILDSEDWNVIDYEWTYQEKLPTAELAYRAFYCYLLGSKKREIVKESDILQILNLTPQQAATIREKENEFQKYVTGNRLAMSEIRNKIGYRMIPLTQEMKEENAALTDRVQVYENTGNGFCEENSYFAANVKEETAELLIPVSKWVTELRIDPIIAACIVSIEKITWNGQKPKSVTEKYTTNGIKTGDNLFVFATNDPNFYFDLSKVEKQEENEFCLKMKVIKLLPEVAEKFKKRRIL